MDNCDHPFPFLHLSKLSVKIEDPQLPASTRNFHLKILDNNVLLEEMQVKLIGLIYVHGNLQFSISTTLYQKQSCSTSEKLQSLNLITKAFTSTWEKFTNLLAGKEKDKISPRPVLPDLF